MCCELPHLRTKSPLNLGRIVEPSRFIRKISRLSFHSWLWLDSQTWFGGEGGWKTLVCTFWWEKHS